MASDRLISILVKAQDEASKVLKSVGEEATKSNKGLDIAKKGLIAIGAAAATATAAVTAFAVKSVKDFLASADALAKMSVKTGIATEELSALKYAGDLSNVSIEQITSAISKMQINMSSTGKASDLMTGALAGLALTMDDFMASSPAEQFQIIGDAIRETEDPAIRAKLAMEAFGKSGVELLPLLTSDMAEATEEAKRLGLIVSTDAAQAAEKFNDNMTRVKSALTGFGMEIANAVLPKLGELAEKWVDNATKFADWVKEMGGISGIKDMVVQNLKEMIGTFDEKTKIITHLQNVWDTLSKFFIEQVMPSLQKLWEALKPFTPLIEFLAKVVGAILVGAFHVLLALIKGSVLVLFGALKIAIDLIVAVLNSMIKVWDWVVERFQKVIEWGQKVIDMFTRIIKAAREAMELVGGGIIGGVKSGISTIGSALGFAEGGIVTRPTFAMIGEAGESEAVIPLSKLPGLLNLQTAGAGVVVNVNGGNYLSEDAARDFGDILADIIKRNRIT